MCADACEAAGLEVPELPQSVRDRLRGAPPAEARSLNPVDMIATATAEQYRRTIATLGEWDGIDALIVIFIRPLLTRAEDVAEAIRAAVQELPRELPVQAVFMSAQDHAAMAGKRGSHLSVPRGRGPEPRPGDAPRRSGAISPTRSHPSFDDVRTEEAAAVIAEALAERAEWLGFERDRPPARLLRDRDPRVAAGRRPGCSRSGRRGARRTGGAEGAGPGDPPQDRDGRRSDRARRRAEVLGRPRRWTKHRRAPALSGRASSSRRWSRAGVELLVGVVERRDLRPGARLRRRRHAGRAAQGRLRADLPASRATRRARCSAPSRSSRC